ncbi:MAG TPA: lytic murein transglycosylase [Rhizomicrobium sp.]|jgi:membrane-bound lytic murein transglycosylase B
MCVALAGLLLGCAGATTEPARKSPPAAAPPISETKVTAESQDAKFASFIRDFRGEAIAAGVTPEIYDRSMSGLRRDPRVEELNTQQPEFVRPIWQYLDSAVSPSRIKKGQEMLATYPTMLAKLEARFSVPKEILVAIWGEESAYGAAMGNFNMFDALATLAYDGPRKEFARHELIAAMKMEQQEHLSPSQMTSSWAGAFGQTQFVPSSFLQNAADGDGDGRKDLWNSPADALASAANLLHQADWHMGEPCLYEVSLPKNFPYELTGDDAPRPMSEWKQLGVRTIYGDELPGTPAEGAIYLPAGARGPAFMVFHNFKVVLTYNNAAAYALAVCNLADHLRGGGQIVAQWPRDEQPLNQEDRVAFQTALKKLGYDPGAIDGVLGHKTRAALRDYQKDHHIPADGFPTKEMLERLNAQMAGHKQAAATE